MKQLTQKIINAIENGQNVVLCTILASSGSSPRGAGARMAVFADGSTAGTIGGGRVEFLAAEEALDVLKTGETRLHAFSLAPEQVASIGMICGGNVTVYYQLLKQEDLPVLHKLRAALSAQENSWLYLRIREGYVEDFRVVSGAEAAQEPELFARRAVYRKGEPLIYTEPLVRAGRVYLFGGGHVGQALVPVLSNVGFRVTVLDNREALANSKTFPSAEQVIFADFSDIYSYVSLTPDDYAVIMTPGHQSDYEVLEQVLRSSTRYVGCIGSRHKIARTQQLLRDAGISEEMIQSVHSPIGLAIGAETPAEIAISIAAEMIQCRAESK